MDPTQNVTDVARAIQLALTPVFLLTGIAGMLNVMTGRLSRIIDRGRTLAENRSRENLSEQDSLELHSLEKRRRFVSIAITACTIAALLLCMVIVTLFVEVMFVAPLQWLIGTLFTISTLALVVGLAFFLREVHMATRSIRLGAGKTL
jgi:Protein of unknown function (DUF2721)